MTPGRPRSGEETVSTRAWQRHREIKNHQSQPIRRNILKKVLIDIEKVFVKRDLDSPFLLKKQMVTNKYQIYRVRRGKRMDCKKSVPYAIIVLCKLFINIQIIVKVSHLTIVKIMIQVVYHLSYSSVENYIYWMLTIFTNTTLMPFSKMRINRLRKSLLSCSIYFRIAVIHVRVLSVGISESKRLHRKATNIRITKNCNPKQDWTR